MKDVNLAWIASGNTGCNFATLFAKAPQKVGWMRIAATASLIIPDGSCLLSIVFPHGNSESVKQWALDNGFYIEQISPMLDGLRLKVGSSVSWVQYFGPDSHVATRRSPQAELLMCLRLPAVQYAKVGFKGILHLAHASIAGIRQRVADKLWETSHRKTAKLLGHQPTVEQAAKTTWKRF